MICEKPELLTDIRDFTTLFCVIFRRKSSEWSESSIESDLVCNLQYGAFTFFKHCFYCKNRSLKRVYYLLIFVIRENEIFIPLIRDRPSFPFVNRARDPPCTTLLKRIT